MIVSRYIAVVIERELDAVRSAPEGARANTLFRSSCAIGSLVGASGLSLSDAERMLVGAATGPRWREPKVHNTVQRGLRYGMQRPRVLPVGLRRTYQAPSPPTISCHAKNRRYPPREEICDLWDCALPVTEDTEVHKWLLSRGLDAEGVELWDLGRALPEGALPSWARLGSKNWRETGHRLLIPLYDALGSFRSFHARLVRPVELKKEVAPTGFEVGGLVMTCKLGQRILAGDTLDWWKPMFVIVEGGPDFMTWAHRQHDAQEDGPAILGIFSGSWTTEIAARIPTGAAVALRGHGQDETGMGYMDRIGATLAGKCVVFRRRNYEVR